jgi:1,4-alpha-glucan branching enzyme
MKTNTIAILILISINLFAQDIVTTNLQYPTQNDSIIIYFDATKGNAGLKDFTGDIYAHTGVITNLSKSGSDWKYVMAPWNQNYSELKLVRDNANLYHLVIGNPRKFYSGNHQNLGTIPPNENILKLAFVFRSSNGSKEGKDIGGKDIFVQLYEPGFSVVVNTPQINTTFGHPDRSPIFIDESGTQNISINTIELGTITKSISLFVNNNKVSVSSTNSLSFDFVASNFSSWKNNIKVIAEDITGILDTVEFTIFKNKTPHEEPLPEGNQIGINIAGTGEVTLALFAPYKEFVYVISNLSDWKVDTLFYMNRYEPQKDSVIWWIKLPAPLSDPTQYYTFQYLIDGKTRIPDPYSETILDPWNDNEVPTLDNPSILPYPTGKTENLITQVITGRSEVYYPYQWKVENFEKPSKEKLVIYEILIRDFVSTHSYKTLTDTLSYFKKLGINAIELMPINEFEGNSSWGYNPMLYFAPDKYYGSKYQLQEFIDACHQNGIAVILDVVLNHSYGSSPMVQMYWDETNNRPAANNPWYNQVSPNQSYSWGYDFNHESNATKYFVDRVTSFWLNEYKVDGFRFDFTKGFTNTPGDGWSYDKARINILKRIADKIWSISPDAYVIFEHLTENSEETELANHGILLWGNLNYNYKEAAMGWLNNSNFSSISYKNRGWNFPNLVGYMESHDEERLMFKNIQYGNSSGSYNIKTLPTALDRIKLAATFFITVPGPKMIWQFGELGYDKSINYPSGTSNDRLTPKPILWEYYSDADRRELFDVFAGLIRLKKAYPVFSSSNFTLSASGAVKTLDISDDTMSVSIIGNFDVVEKTGQFSSKSISKWYEFFSGDSISVSDVSTQVYLQPGEYRLYSSKKLPALDIIVGVKDDKENIPTEFMLMQNYPNPFNPKTKIEFSLPSQSYAKVVVYDILGNEVAKVFDGNLSAGKHKVEWNAANNASGIYLYKLTTPGFTQVKKMMLIK